MSAYIEGEIEIKDIELFIESLIEVYGKEYIIVGNKMQLEGFMGDKRDTTADIIIKRRAMGGSSNDGGYRCDNGIWKEVLSSFDRSCSRVMDKLNSAKMNYAEEILKPFILTHQVQGYQVQRVQTTKGIQVKLTSMT